MGDIERKSTGRGDLRGSASLRLGFLVLSSMVAGGCSCADLHVDSWLFGCRSNDECASGFECVEGRCRPPGEGPGPCDGGECAPADAGCDVLCPIGSQCQDNGCVESSCASVTCGPNELCGKGACYGRTCNGSTCAAGTLCWQGGCVPPACVAVSCAANEVCGAGGQCAPKSCQGVVCDNGLACVAGTCVSATCVGVSCPTGKACSGGKCVPTSCGSAACPDGWVCDLGTCVSPLCVGVSCAPGEVCAGGTCTARDCTQAECPPASYCDQGKCVPVDCAGVTCVGNARCAKASCFVSNCLASTCGSAQVCVNEVCVDALCVGKSCAAGLFCKNGACVPPGDTDGDTIPDTSDNCPLDYNRTQKDSDRDSAGDVCDCAATDPTVFPGATEHCGDQKDNNCDTKADCEDTACAAPCSPKGLVFLTEPQNVAVGALLPAIQVAVEDFLGNTKTSFAGSVTLALASNPGNTTLGGTAVANTQNGVAAFTDLSVPVAGTSYRLGASSVGLDPAQSSAFDVLDSVPSASMSSIAAVPSTVVADGTSTSLITVTVKDSLGTPIPGLVVQLVVSGGSYTLTQPQAVTDQAGKASGRLACTRAEAKAISAIINPGSNPVSVNGPAVVFFANPATIDANLSTATANPTSLWADGVSTTTVTVTVKDENANPVPAQTVVLSVSGPGATLVQPVATTDPNGIATGTLKSTKAEVKTLTATINPVTSSVVVAQKPQVTFNANPATLSATLSTAVASPLSVVANGVAVSTVTVTVVDANENPLSGQTVQLSSSGSANTISSPATTGANGQATLTLASTKAEVKTATVTVNPGPFHVDLVQPLTITFTADPSTLSASLSSAVASPLSVVANGVATSTVTVTVKDANGNPVPNQTVELSSTGSANVFSQPGPTDSSGQTTGTLASTKAEAKQVTATLNPAGSAVVLNQKPDVTFTADPSTLSASLSSAVASPLSVVANGVATSTVTVTVKDANNNPVPGQAVQLSSTGTANVFSQPGPTDSSGQTTGTLASTKAEAKQVTATLNPAGSAVVLNQKPDVTFTADATTLSPSLSSAVASPTTLLADGTAVSTVTVTAKDANDNPVPGQAVQLSSTGSANVFSQPGPTDSNGQTTGTLASTKAEAKTVTATLNPGGSPVAVNQQPNLTFTANPATISASLSTLIATPTTVFPDGDKVALLTVTVKDANGNPVPGQTVELSVTGAGLTLTQPSGPTNALGVTTGTLASSIAQTKTVSATVNPSGTPVLLTQTATIIFAGKDSLGPVCSASNWCWEHPRPMANTLQAFWGANDTAVWGVGGAGSILFWNGHHWAGQLSGVTPNLKAAWGSSLSDVWAVGEGGVTTHWNGTSWGSVASGQSVVLNAVWGANATDVWAVGAGGKTLHWDGASWAAPSSSTTNNLNDVWGTGSTDVWAVGDTVGGVHTILHWSGSSWSRIAPGPFAQTLTSLWGADPSHVWAVGNFGTVGFWNGTAWSQPTSNTPNHLYKAWGNNASDVWAVGGGGTAIQWNGTQWVNRSGPTSSDLRAVRGFGTSDVWAVGAGGTAVHWDGSMLSLVTSETTQSLWALWTDGTGDVWAGGGLGTVAWWNGTSLGTKATGNQEGVTALWGDSPTNMWAVGNAGTAFRRTGSTWTELSTGTTKWLRDVWGFGPSDVWAVGHEGTTTHWNGSSFTVVPTGITGNLIKVWGISPTDVWAAGDNCYALHWDGSAWTIKQGYAGCFGAYLDIWGTAPNNVFFIWAAMGEYLQKWNGASWSTVVSGTNVRGLWGLSPTTAWAVGYNSGGPWGMTWRWDGNSSWPSWGSATSNRLLAVWGADPSNVWAVGYSGTIIRFNGIEWALEPPLTTVNLSRVWGLSATQVWAAGNPGTLLSYNGTSWSVSSSGTLDGIADGWAVGPSDAWVAGGNGSILHWTP